MSNETNWSDLVDGNELLKAKKYRASNFEERQCHSADVDDPQYAGWETFWESKNGKKVKIRKGKAIGDAFEDKVWMMFFKLGFKVLNKGRRFVLCDGTGHSQQIDIFAVDDDSVVIVECKATAERKSCNFKKDIEAFEGHRKWINKLVGNKFPNRKIKFVWAMSNYYPSKADRERINAAKMVLFNEDTVTYYTDLAGHLGVCAKYQFYARLYANTKILGKFDNRVLAIKSKLGKYGCYSFAIDPARLLKLSYVLHHHPTNNDLMPAYQRLIKKPRLIQIRKFIEEDNGYFANSLIISIDTKRRGLLFERIKSNIPDEMSQVGVLHLPSKYCSAYVIDGQHRLYAYSGSELARTQSVPVIAFVDLQQREQLKLFMDINENQKSVPKSLRVTLNADMLWDSPVPREKRQAIASKVAQLLEDDKKSKLYGRIIVGENETSKDRRVTVLAIQDALAKSGLLNIYGRNDNKVAVAGLLDLDDSDKTKELIYEVMFLIFDHVYDACTETWEMTDEDSTILVTNRGIQAIIRIIGDILRFLVDNKYIEEPKKMSAKDITQDILPYLSPLCDFFNSATDEERKTLRNHLGGSADTKFWREFQKIIHSKFDKFNPPGLEQYLLDETKQFNEETEKRIYAISKKVLEIFDDNYFARFDTDDECLKGLPKAVYKRISKLKSEFEYEHKDEDVSFRLFVTNGDLRELALIPHLWADTFEPLLTPPWIRKGASKKIKTQWLSWLDEIANKMKNKGFSVPAKDAKAVQDLYEWIVTND